MAGASATPRGADATPLVVDVDGTLLRTDLLHEAALQFVARHPWESWRLLSWTFGGKPRLKANLADRIAFSPATLPMSESVVAAIRAAQAEGRPVYLASASDARYVAALGQHLGGIAGTFGSDAGRNLSGAVKAEVLNEAFGSQGYDYIGNANVDLPIWRSARTPLVTNAPAGLVRTVTRDLPHAEILDHPRAGFRTYFRMLRAHQWAKNALVFLPLVAGHYFTPHMILTALLAFACFCCAASSAYVINDLFDLASDREHRTKRNRPFAAGEIPVGRGPSIAALLLLLALAIAWFLPLAFLGVLALYIVLTLAYSLVLKRALLVDVIVLGGLYAIRVLGGLSALDVRDSPWLLMFCLFLFMGLAIVKRCSELVAKRNAGGGAMLTGRGYHVEDIAIMLGLGAAAGYGSVLVIALYIASAEVQALYHHHTRLWLLCPLLLYWISRVLILANRDELHEDPVIFALTDRVSWAVGLLAALVIAVSI